MNNDSGCGVDLAVVDQLLVVAVVFLLLLKDVLLDLMMNE